MDDWELLEEFRLWFEDAKNFGPRFQNGFMVITRDRGVSLIPMKDLGRSNFREFVTKYVSVNMSQELPWLIGLD